RDAERRHDPVGLCDAGLRWLPLREDDLELEEVPEVLDPVEVDARPSDQIERAMLADASGAAIGERKRLAQGIGRGRGGEDEEGVLGTGLGAGDQPAWDPVRR